MRSSEEKASWLKFQINSAYGLGLVSTAQDNKWSVDYQKIKEKIRLISNRRNKINKLWKIDGIV